MGKLFEFSTNSHSEVKSPESGTNSSKESVRKKTNKEID